MNIESSYKTNEIQGSFWKPDDYMKTVPNPHVIGKENGTDEQFVSGVQLELHNGMENEFNNESNNENSAEKNTVVYSSVDGRVRLVAPNNFDYSV